MSESGQTYVCAVCGREFESTMSEEDAKGAYEQFMGDDFAADKVTPLCPDCYRAELAEFLRHGR
jgi:hypothetical protein